jgi:hypothetical protein
MSIFSYIMAPYDIMLAYWGWEEDQQLVPLKSLLSCWATVWDAQKMLAYYFLRESYTCT